MKVLRRIAMGIGGTVVVALVIGLAAPKTVRAVVSTLVTVVNTSANPVPNRDVDNSANFPFSSEVCDGDANFCQGITDQFTAPAATSSAASPSAGPHATFTFFVETPEAIHIATENGAKFLGQSERIGTIAVGKQADLVVIAGDPSKQISDIRQVEVVFKEGVGYSSAKLFWAVRGLVGVD
jgi:hypothetical protein